MAVSIFNSILSQSVPQGDASRGSQSPDASVWQISACFAPADVCYCHCIIFRPVDPITAVKMSPPAGYPSHTSCLECSVHYFTCKLRSQLRASYTWLSVPVSALLRYQLALMEPVEHTVYTTSYQKKHISIKESTVTAKKMCPLFSSN